MKRTLDLVLSISGLIIFSPVIILFMLLVWLQDWQSPLYIAPRVAKGGGVFNMVKLRSMVVRADRSGLATTKQDDARITGIGRIIRKFKLDELTQLWNVVIGDMSLVGPRPQVQRDVSLYTDIEKHLLSVRPGITDFSSIIFSDEGEILAGRNDPDLHYQQLIRPWKSELGLFYIEHQSLLVDIRLIWLTILNSISRESALNAVSNLLRSLGANERLYQVATRSQQLQPCAPPGATDIFQGR